MAAGIGSESMALLPSHLSKWGIQIRTLNLPAVDVLKSLSLIVKLHCYVRKAVWCKGRTKTSEVLECNVKKETRLKSVTYVFAHANLATLCSTAGGTHTNGVPGVQTCENPAPGNLVLFANISTPNDACSAVVKLL